MILVTPLWLHWNGVPHAGTIGGQAIADSGVLGPFRITTCLSVPLFIKHHEPSCLEGFQQIFKKKGFQRIVKISSCDRRSFSQVYQRKW